MKVRRFKSFRFKILMYVIYSIIATALTECIILMGLYTYETEILAKEYRSIWGDSSSISISGAHLVLTNSGAMDVMVFALFTAVLMTIYFLLFSHNFVMYVREIMDCVDKMRNGDLLETVPVKGEDEFSEIAVSINEMKENLYDNIERQRQEEQTKDELITNVAHDLRTPLTSILGYLDLLMQSETCSEEQKMKYLGIVSAKARQLETLIKDLFDYTRYDENKVQVKKSPFDLNLFVPQLVEEFYPSFMDNHLECRTHFYEGSLNIDANGDLLARAVGNLFSNAIKYGADGKLVEVETGITGSMAYVAVINYGRIIPKEDLEKIFDKFYRVENSRSLKTGGTGLGLAIAKNIVGLHDGEIWVSSDESGTRFQIELPLLEQSRQDNISTTR